MKKYLREIEFAGLVMVIGGVVCSFIWGAPFGAWLCGIGLLFWLVSFLYKAFHWNEYARENKQNIIILLIAIFILLLQMIIK